MLVEPTGGVLGNAHEAGRFHVTRQRKVPEDQLKHSHYYRDPKGVWYKTCPECSRQAGNLVWHGLSEFSHRTVGTGHVIPQSWCGLCRSK